MTQEEKARKKYNSKYHPNMGPSGVYLNDADLEEIFPQLRESEDERIRKWLIKYFNKADFNGMLEYVNGIKAEDILAWLEKQKYDRMKPVYDARESFESALEKAWNDYHNGYENVDKLEDDYVECTHAKGFREGYLFGIEKQKEISDTRTADDLQLLGFIYDLLASLDWRENYAMSKEECLRRLNDYRPQKPVGWSEEDEEALKRAIDCVRTWEIDYCDGDNKISERLKSLRPQPKQEWSEEDENIRKWCISHFKECFHVSKDNLEFKQYLNNKIIPWLEKQKPLEWSEKDEKMKESIIKALYGGGHFAYEPEITWLKSLPLNLKKKNEDVAKLCSNEWSKDDEHRLTDAIYFLESAKKHYADTSEIEKTIDWLKFLRPQPKQNANDMITPNKKFFQWIYDRLVNVHKENPNVDYMISFKRRIEELWFDEPHWKPSEEQMEALGSAINYLTEHTCTPGNPLLISLYTNLQKLL